MFYFTNRPVIAGMVPRAGGCLRRVQVAAGARLHLDADIRRARGQAPPWNKGAGRSLERCSGCYSSTSPYFRHVGLLICSTVYLNVNVVRGESSSSLTEILIGTEPFLGALISPGMSMNP